MRLQVTIGMSALWDREIGTMSHTINITSQLELRNIPQIYQNAYITSEYDYVRAKALSSIY